MLEAIRPLLDGSLINEETQRAINEAWEAKLVEAREQARADLKEEYAQRYEHDKRVMVEALDRMVTDGITAELKGVRDEKTALAEERVQYRAKMKESITKFNDFLVTKLAEEISELRNGRKENDKSVSNLKEFVKESLQKELSELHEERKNNKLKVKKLEEFVVNQLANEIRELREGRKKNDRSIAEMERFVTKSLTEEIQELLADKQAKKQKIQELEEFVTDSLASEINELRNDREMNKLKTQQLEEFIKQELANEVEELRNDRNKRAQQIETMNEFVAESLSKEIVEFAQDKRAVVETRVRLVQEARTELERLKARFIKESAAKTKHLVTTRLKAELSQLHEDIKVARENDFGRKIFEAYAAEFGSTYLNEKTEVAKLNKVIAEKDVKLSEATKQSQKTKSLLENKEKEIRMIKESNERENTVAELLAPLNESKRRVMQNLLESVPTVRLKSAFEKYLPAVLADTSNKRSRNVLNESVSVVTGDKSAKPVKFDNVENDNVNDIIRLAGLNNQ